MCRLPSVASSARRFWISVMLTSIAPVQPGHYDRTLKTTSCSRAWSITFRPKSSFGPTSVVGAWSTSRDSTLWRKSVVCPETCALPGFFLWIFFALPLQPPSAEREIDGGRILSVRDFSLSYSSFDRQRSTCGSMLERSVYHSTLMPALSTTLPHLCVSSRIRSAKRSLSRTMTFNCCSVNCFTMHRCPNT